MNFTFFPGATSKIITDEAHILFPGDSMDPVQGQQTPALGSTPPCHLFLLINSCRNTSSYPHLLIVEQLQQSLCSLQSLKYSSLGLCRRSLLTTKRAGGGYHWLVFVSGHVCILPWHWLTVLGHPARGLFSPYFTNKALRASVTGPRSPSWAGRNSWDLHLCPSDKKPELSFLPSTHLPLPQTTPSKLDTVLDCTSVPGRTGWPMWLLGSPERDGMVGWG